MAHRIAECKKLRTSAEEVILCATVDFACTIIGEGAAKKLNLVTLSDDTMCCRIGNMAENIYDQQIDQMKQRDFGLQLDEATDDSRDAHLNCYARFVDFSKQNLEEELIFCKPIELRRRGIDLFNLIDNFIPKKTT